MFLGTSTGVFRSTDDGLSWTKLSHGLVYDPVVVSLLTQDTSTIFAGCFTVGPQGTEWRIARSSDNGENWYTVDSTHAVYSFCAASADTIFAGTYGSGILWSNNRGATWVPFGNTAAYIASILATPRYVFAGSKNGGGIYRCLHTTDSIQTVNSGLSNTTVNCLAVSPEGIVFAGSENGPFRSSNGGNLWSGVPLLTSVRNDGGVIPQRAWLENNYPNPFNPTTSIRYTVGGVGGLGSGTSQVRLAVYDLLGREVAVLVNEKKAPGSYEVKFDGGGLSSGVYLYRLQAGSQVQTKKMVMVK